jgi:hypothetical protein
MLMHCYEVHQRESLAEENLCSVCLKLLCQLELYRCLEYSNLQCDIVYSTRQSKGTHERLTPYISLHIRIPVLYTFPQTMITELV